MTGAQAVGLGRADCGCVVTVSELVADSPLPSPTSDTWRAALTGLPAGATEADALLVAWATLDARRQRVDEVRIGYGDPSLGDGAIVPFRLALPEGATARDRLAAAARARAQLSAPSSAGEGGRAAIVPGGGTSVETAVRLRGPEPTDAPVAGLRLWVEAWSKGDGLGIVVRGAEGTDPAEVGRALGRLQALLEGMLNEPDRPLRELSAIGAEEAEEVLALAGGDGPTTDLLAASVPAAFAARVAATPHDPALMTADETLSFAQLDACALTVAAKLEEVEVEPGDIVGVCIPRSAHLAASILGAWRVGATFLPLDPRWPEARLKTVLGDSKAKAVLCLAQGDTNLPDDVATQRVFLGDLWPPPPPKAPHPIEPESPAYVLYTSGSTGTPKGVVVPHRALLAHAEAITATFGLSSDDRCLQFTAPIFDVSLEELIPTWLAGACTVLRSDEAASSLGVFLREVQQSRITVLNLPSAFFTELAVHGRETGETLPASVRLVVAGGERVSPRAYADWRERHPRVRFLNGYGPTETTVTSTVCDPVQAGVVADGRRELPIGRPLGRCRAYIVEPGGTLAPRGALGELWIAGPQVALGYLGRPEKTAEVFGDDPWGAGPRYRTGDLVRWSPGGQLEFLGRVDHQVKIRGHRIEPGEIAAALVADRRVRDAYVGVRPDANGNPRLVAWVVPVEEGAVSASALLKLCEAQLPPTLVPSALGLVSAFPLTASGKVDHRALETPADAAGRGDYVPPVTDRELCVARIFEDLLGLEKVSATGDFFDLGGHSLLAVRLLSRLNAGQSGAKVELAHLFQDPTVRGLAEVLDGSGHVGQSHLVQLNKSDATGHPLFCVCGVQIYAELGRALATERPVYGAFLPVEQEALEDPTGAGFDVQTMARQYLELIRAKQPTGPYFLSGISFGGMVAFEMARQLEAQGERVGLLVLLDTFLTRGVKPRGLGGKLRMRIRETLKTDRSLREYVRDRFHGLTARLLRTKDEEGPSDGRTADLHALRSALFVKAAMRFEQQAESHPVPFKGRALIFRASEGLAGDVARDEYAPDLGWGELLAPGTERKTVTGTHVGILKGPGVEEMVAVLRPRLAMLDARPSLTPPPPVNA